LTSIVIAGEGLPAEVAGRSRRARSNALRPLWVGVLLLGAAGGAAVLAGAEASRTRRDVLVAQSENRALRSRQEALIERAVTVDEQLAASLEPTSFSFEYRDGDGKAGGE
jgi:hypothetical protein